MFEKVTERTFDLPGLTGHLQIFEKCSHTRVRLLAALLTWLPSEQARSPHHPANLTPVTDTVLITQPQADLLSDHGQAPLKSAESSSNQENRQEDSQTPKMLF